VQTGAKAAEAADGDVMDPPEHTAGPGPPRKQLRPAGRKFLCRMGASRCRAVRLRRAVRLGGCPSPFPSVTTAIEFAEEWKSRPGRGHSERDRLRSGPGRSLPPGTELIIPSSLGSETGRDDLPPTHGSGPGRTARPARSIILPQEVASVMPGTPGSRCPSQKSAGEFACGSGRWDAVLDGRCGHWVFRP